MKTFLNILVLTVMSLLVSSQTYGVEYTPLTMVGLGAIQLGIQEIQPLGVALETIPVQDARALYTKKIVAVYKEKVTPKSFLRSFFKESESMTKNVSIAVRRGSERIAVDVSRSSNGNANKFSKSTEKMFTPPFYFEYFTANDHDLYDMAINGSVPAFTQMTAEHAEQLVELRSKIERAYELQAAQVFQTGVVTLENGTNIDFKRKALSMVDKGAGNYWATGTVDPYADLKTGADFIRSTGRTKATIFTVIMGADAFDDFMDNTKVKARADIRNFALDDLKLPQENSVGGVYHGRVSSGSYKFDIWTYPETYEYEDAAGDIQEASYIDSKNIVVLPQQTNFDLAYAAVPRLLKDGTPGPVVQGAYLVQEFFDDRRTAHDVAIKSAGVAVPTAVDTIWTAQVVAS